MKVQTDNKHYVRDVRSRALLLSDKSVAEEYKVRRSMLDKNKELTSKLEDLEEKIRRLESMIGDSIGNKST